MIDVVLILAVSAAIFLVAWEVRIRRKQRKSIRSIRTQARADEKFQELLALEENWDSYGAPPLDRDSVDSAWHYVRSLDHQDLTYLWIVPTVDGNVQLEWHHGPITLELEFHDDNTVVWLRGQKKDNFMEVGETGAYTFFLEPHLEWFQDAVDSAQHSEDR